jgi:hypothetical protein
VGAGEPGHQVAERVGHRLEERLGHPHRQRRPQRVPEPGGVLDGGPPFLAADPKRQGAARRRQLPQPLPHPFGVRGSCRRLGLGQVPDPAEQVVQPVRVGRPSVTGHRLQLELDLLRRPRLDQLPQLDPTQQLREDRPVQRQRLRTALGQRRVALVHERRDVAEQQRAGERRRHLGVHLDHPDLAPPGLGHEFDQPGEVEHVLEALAERLQDHRERAELGGHLEQARAPLPLLPQRRSASRPPLRQQQGAGRAFAEAAGEQRRVPQLGHHQLLDLLGLEQDRLGRRGLVGLREPDHDPVVRVHGLDLEAETVPDPRLDRLGPGRVDLGPEGRMHAHPPVAKLVPEAFDHDGAVVGKHAGGVALLVQILDEVPGGELVQPGGPEPLQAGGRGQRVELAQERAQGPAELDRPARRVPVPKRKGAGDPRGRHHHDAVVRDLDDPPAGCAQHDDVAEP